MEQQPAKLTAESTSMPSVMEALRSIPGDTKIICRDNKEFTIIGPMVAKRGGPTLKRYFDGTMKEGIEKVIRFPTRDYCTVRVFMNYLQFGDRPITNIETDVNLYLMADEYQVEPLKDLIMKDLLASASSLNLAFIVYERCDHELLLSVRNKAYETICRFMKTEVKLVCDKCGRENFLECGTCAKMLNPETPGKCLRHTSGIDNTSCYYTGCGGKLKKAVYDLGLSMVSNETIIEVIKKRYG